MPKSKFTFIKLNKRDLAFLHNDELILQVLKTFNKPLSLEMIALLSGLRKDKCSQVLKSLQKYGMVRKYYKRTVSFWGLGEKNE
jgi:DNA-binding transcriptional regulator GbsR (MarR family)